MYGATDSPAPVSRAENRNRSNRSSKASRQSGFGHTAGPWRRSSVVGSNKPPFRNGRRPSARAAADARLRGGSRRRSTGDAGRRGGSGGAPSARGRADATGSGGRRQATPSPARNRGRGRA